MKLLVAVLVSSLLLSGCVTLYEIDYDPIEDEFTIERVY